MAAADRAQNAYAKAVDDLQKYCEDQTDLEPYIDDSRYPIRIKFFPKTQTSLFGNNAITENVNENGEVNDLTVTVGLTTSVKSSLKFKMAAAQLKKLIKLAEKVGGVYYHAFREEADKEEKTRE